MIPNVLQEHPERSLAKRKQPSDEDDDDDVVESPKGPVRKRGRREEIMPAFEEETSTTPHLEGAGDSMALGADVRSEEKMDESQEDTSSSSGNSPTQSTSLVTAPTIQPVQNIVQPSVTRSPDNPGHMTNHLQYLQNIVLPSLWEHKYCWPFYEPVNTVENCVSVCYVPSFISFFTIAFLIIEYDIYFIDKDNYILQYFFLISSFS